MNSKPLHWMGASLKDLRDLPDEVKYEVGFAIRSAQEGGKVDYALPMMGFGGAGVLGVRTDCGGNTYRTVYTVKFPKAVYVLHVFQKKSKRGRKTPQRDVELVRSRLSAAEEHHKENYTTVGKREKRHG